MKAYTSFLDDVDRWIESFQNPLSIALRILIMWPLVIVPTTALLLTQLFLLPFFILACWAEKRK